MTTALISCSKSKRPYDCKAKELYRASALFRLSYDFATKQGWNIKILSAKYGVLDPETIISPYNVTLTTMSAGDAREWGAKVAAQLNTIEDELVFLAGKAYTQPITDSLQRPFTILMEGLGLGRRLQWLKKQLSY